MNTVAIFTTVISVSLCFDALWKHIQNWVRPKPELVIKEAYRKRELGELEEDSDARLRNRGRYWRQFRDVVCSLVWFRKPEHAKEVDWEMRFQFWPFKTACWKLIAAPVEAIGAKKTVIDVLENAKRDIVHTQWYMERNHIVLPFGNLTAFIVFTWLFEAPDHTEGLPLIESLVKLHPEAIQIGAIITILATGVIGYIARRLLRRRTRREILYLERLANRIVSAKRKEAERTAELQDA